MRDVQREQELKDIKELMDSAQGRRVIFRLLEKSKLFKQTFAGDALTTAFLEGARSIGLMLFADISKVATKKYMVMCLEAKELAEKQQKEQEKINQEDNGNE